MTAEQGRALMDRLEAEVDRHGLYAVLECLRDVANAKGTHLVEAWQDRPGAKEWVKAAIVLERAGAKVSGLGIPDPS